MTDLFSKFDPLIQQREDLLASGVTDPFNLVMEKVESPTVAICNGKRTILLGTYNYMGMTFDPDVVAAGHKALDEFGSGTTGSRVRSCSVAIWSQDSAGLEYTSRNVSTAARGTARRSAVRARP